MTLHMDKIRISHDFKHKDTHSIHSVYDSSDYILEWREKKHYNKNGEYLVPFKV